MKLNNQNKMYLISVMLLTLTVMVSVHAQDAKPKKEIRITIMQDGKIKRDTSFEIKRDIQKEELDAMVEAFQKKPNTNKNFLPRWRHRDEAFAFPYNEMPNFQMLDSMFKNNHGNFDFSMKFDNDSVFEKYFKGIGPDSVFTYKWKFNRNDSSVPCPCEGGINDINLLNPNDINIFEIIDIEGINNNEDQMEIINETTVPTDTNKNKVIVL